LVLREKCCILQVITTVQFLHDKLFNKCNCICSTYCQICIKTAQKLTKNDISFLVSVAPKMFQITSPAT